MSIWPWIRSGACWAFHVTAASQQKRALVAPLAKQVQAVTVESVDLPYVNPNYTG